MSGEPFTAAGRELVAAIPANAADCASPEFIRHVVDVIRRIEKETLMLAEHGNCCQCVNDEEGNPIQGGPSERVA